MSYSKLRAPLVGLVLSLTLGLALGCGSGRRAGGGGARPTASGGAALTQRTLTFAAYTTPREAYGEILAAFKAQRRAQNHEELTLRESYQGSGAMARAVIGGFDADVVALSLEQDIDSIREAGLITHDFRTVGAYGGMVTRSVVVLAVRKGNPKHIAGWQDLRRADVDVLTPNVRTSGGAMWNVAALWGAALRGKAGVAANDPAAAETLLGDVLARVRIMDRSGRDSMLSFERGVGDVAITYENEVLLGRSQGKDYEYVLPEATVRIENPIAVVDRNVERHHTRDLAEAFLAFVVSDEAQRIFARNGYRPVNPTVEAATASSFRAVPEQFAIGDVGGWQGLERQLFAEGAAYDRAQARSRR